MFWFILFHKLLVEKVERVAKAQAYYYIMIRIAKQAYVHINSPPPNVCGFKNFAGVHF